MEKDAEPTMRFRECQKKRVRVILKRVYAF
jgi:hypothetical protein